MNLIEIFDTKQTITWKPTRLGYSGETKFNGKKLNLVLDEYELSLDKNYHVIDFGFLVDDSWKLTHANKDASQILGIVLNGFIEQIRILQPDIILFGVNTKNGDVEQRKSLYERISRLYAKGSSYHHESKWIKTANGEYKFIAKINLSVDVLDKITKFAGSIEIKN